MILLVTFEPGADTLSTTHATAWGTGPQSGRADRSQWLHSKRALLQVDIVFRRGEPDVGTEFGLVQVAVPGGKFPPPFDLPGLTLGIDGRSVLRVVRIGTLD